MRASRKLILAGIGLSVLSTPALAQPLPDSGSDSGGIAETSGEIVVTARRREESLQDVPQTVNVVTGAQIERLNLRNFTEISNVVPGLQLTAASAFSNTATVRGIAFDPVASGNNSAVEFYLNDTPIAAGFLFKSTYDLGQFELLRGPQGTLRGRASPSGSITVGTRKPDLDEVGLVVNGTITDLHARKIDGALNIPIIRDMLAVRIAGVIDNNRGNRVHSLYETTDPSISRGPYSVNESLRASVRFEPFDWGSFFFMYQNLHAKDHAFTQAASESVLNPAAPVSATELVRPFDRRAIDEQGVYSRQDQEVFIGNAEIRFAGQKINYAGSHTSQDFGIAQPNDNANFFSAPRVNVVGRVAIDPAGFFPVCSSEAFTFSTGAYNQCTHSGSKRDSHELRLSSDERIGGIFDYVIGAFYDRNNSPTDLTQETPVVANAGAVPLTLLTVSRTAILRRSITKEKSAFANIGAHLLDDRLEISGGLRYIDFRSENALFQAVGGGTQQCAELASNPVRCTVTRDGLKRHATIYTGSIKYKITPDIMVYALTGSSWRVSPRVVGNFSAGPGRNGQTARERAFAELPPETSKSYEVGLKASFLDGRAHLNLSAYRQTFKNYPFFGPQTFFITTNAGTGVETVGTLNNPGNAGFVSPVPVTVTGGEAELSIRLLNRWNLSLNGAYADGKIKNGTIACTDLNGDNVPDQNATLPTLAALQAAVGAGQTVGICSGINRRAAVTPKFSANVQTEYDFDVGNNADGFVRGLYSFFGKTSANPDNAFDDVGAYGILNLYAGIRGKDGSWEVSLFGKNITQEREVLTVNGSLLSTSLQQGATGVVRTSPYRSITVTAPREFGVSARIAIGSR